VIVSRYATCGLPDVGLDLELALHAVDDDLEVQLAHAGDDGLAGSPDRSAPGRRDLPARGG
jgi:hypothetical protein